MDEGTKHVLGERNVIEIPTDLTCVAVSYTHLLGIWKGLWNMWIRKMKEKLRHPGIFLKILILFECILIIAVLVTSSYIMQRFSKTVMEKEIMLGDTKLDSLTDYCNDKYNRIYSLYNYIPVSYTHLKDTASPRRRARLPIRQRTAPRS